MPLHRHHLGGLMLQCVEAVQVPCENLYRSDNCRHPHRHREHFARTGIGAIFEQMPRTHGTNGKGRGQIGGQYGVDQAVRKAGVENDYPPAWPRHELAVRRDLISHRGLHPAVDRENPEGRDEGAERYRQRRDEMQLAPDLVDAEQHHAQESGFEEEGSEHFIGHERPDHWPGAIRKDRPVGAKLVGHDDA